MISADNILGAQTYYDLDASHGAMMTEDGSRQLIENLLTGSSQDTKNLITTDKSQCRYSAQMISVHSPVDMNIYDEAGEHLGPNPDGSIDFGISGAQYDIIDHSKYAILPLGHTYTVKLTGTGNGTFDFYSTRVVNNQTQSTAYYNQVPVTISTQAQLVLNTDNSQVINVDNNGDGITDQIFSPSAITDIDPTQDLVPPVTTDVISGTQGQAGFYRSNISVTLTATDPDDNASGVLQTLFSLDNGQTWNRYASPISVSSEGPHSLEFYSIDKIGNKENPQTIIFTIDKTAPEFMIQFDPNIKDIRFTGTDNISASNNITVQDND